MLLQSKVVLVTGAAGGIGRAVALACCEQGARVVVNDVGCDVGGDGHDAAAASDVARELASCGGEAVASDDDISTNEGAQRAVRCAIDTFGDLDAVVCAAGIGVNRTLLKTDEGDWDRVIQVLLKGTFLTMRAAAQRMIEMDHPGRMVAMTGLGGYLGQFGLGAMAAAQGGLHGLVRTAAIEWQKHKITVNAVAPLAQTRMTHELGLLEGFDNLTVRHVVPLVLMLCSDLCGERSGHVLSAAGPRMYALRFVESAGRFKEADDGVFTPEQIDEAFQAITKV